MADNDPLPDDDVHTRLVSATDALGTAPGKTTHGNTALVAARRALLMFQIALVTAMDKASGDLPPDATDSEPSPPE